jgi:hypothetical protein
MFQWQGKSTDRGPHRRVFCFEGGALSLPPPVVAWLARRAVLPQENPQNKKSWPAPDLRAIKPWVPRLFQARGVQPAEERPF